MEIFTAFGVAFVSGGGMVALFNWFTKRKLTKKQEKQTEAKTDEIAVNFLSKALETINEQVVNPLREELADSRKSNNKLSNDVKKLTRAIEKIPGCTHASVCPVSVELQDYKNGD
jgi:hypothetical protein